MALCVKALEEMQAAGDDISKVLFGGSNLYSLNKGIL